eukprot:962986_1
MKWRFVLGIFLVFVLQSGALANLTEGELDNDEPIDLDDTDLEMGNGGPHIMMDNGSDDEQLELTADADEIFANFDLSIIDSNDGGSDSDDFFDLIDDSSNVNEDVLPSENDNGGEPKTGGKHTNVDPIEVVSHGDTKNVGPKDGDHDDMDNVDHGDMGTFQGTDCTKASDCGVPGQQDLQDCVEKTARKSVFAARMKGLHHPMLNALNLFAPMFVALTQNAFLRRIPTENSQFQLSARAKILIQPNQRQIRVLLVDPTTR